MQLTIPRNIYRPIMRQITDDFYGFSPIQLGSKLARWWDADNINTLSIDGSNRVASWRDQVAGIAYTESTDASKPIYSPANGWNGFPSLTGDGTAQSLTMSSPSALTGTNTGEIWILCQQNALAADTTERFVFSTGVGTQNNDLRVGRVVSTGVNRSRFRLGTGAAVVSMQGTAVDFSSRHLLRCVKDSTSASLTTDTATAIPGTVTANINSTRSRMFALCGTSAASFWSGSIREIIVTSLLTTEEANNLATYMLNRRAL